jgi:tRNA-modifying protein YgfZ
MYPASGFLRIKGEDRIDYLQRQTTNDLMSLSPGDVLKTVLTSATARILDIFYLFMDDDDSLGAITLPGYAMKTTDYLKKRIFFRDKVTVSDLSHEYLQIDIEGPYASEALLQVGIDCPKEIGRLTVGDLDGHRMILVSKLGFVQIGYRILIHPDHVTHLVAALDSAGVKQITEEDYEILRIESGIPVVGKEISEKYTPLELNMEEAISNQKGCYTGQEVIARQITYDKIARRMVGLHLDEAVSPHAFVHVDGKLAGEVTSVALSPRFGMLALAILKRPYFFSGIDVDILDEDLWVRGRVSQLPFRESPES